MKKVKKLNSQKTKITHDYLADPTNNCLVKLSIIKNGYAKDQNRK